MITLIIILVGLIIGGILFLLGAVVSPILLGLGVLVLIDAVTFSVIRLLKKWLSKK